PLVCGGLVLVQLMCRELSGPVVISEGLLSAVGIGNSAMAWVVGLTCTILLLWIPSRCEEPTGHNSRRSLTLHSIRSPGWSLRATQVTLPAARSGSPEGRTQGASQRRAPRIVGRRRRIPGAVCHSIVPPAMGKKLPSCRKARCPLATTYARP